MWYIGLFIFYILLIHYATYTDQSLIFESNRVQNTIVVYPNELYSIGRRFIPFQVPFQAVRLIQLTRVGCPSMSTTLVELVLPLVLMRRMRLGLSSKGQHTSTSWVAVDRSSVNHVLASIYYMHLHINARMNGLQACF